MSVGTVTRADLAEAVYREIGLSRTESADLVVAVIDNIIDALIRGETVKLAGFGTFSLRDKSERIGRNPCLLYTSPSPRDQRGSRMPSSA